MNTKQKSSFCLTLCDNLKRYKCQPCIWFIWAFLSTMVFNSIYSDPILEDNTTASTAVNVSEYEFFDKLRNPCSLVNASSLQRDAFNQSDRAAIRLLAVNEVKSKSLSLRNRTAEAIRKTDVIENCTSLELPAVAIIPSDAYTLNNKTSDVLGLFYTSLLNHTAHVYFISEQLQLYSNDTTCDSSSFNTSVESLASDMRDLLCILRLTTLTLEDDGSSSFENSTEQILNEEFVDQPLCSRRFIRDCQVVRSTVALLRQLSKYLQRTALDGDSAESAEEIEIHDASNQVPDEYTIEMTSAIYDAVVHFLAVYLF